MHTVINSLPTQKSPGPNSFSGVLPDFKRRVNVNTPQSIPQGMNRRNIVKFILFGHSYSDTQTLYAFSKERELQTNFSYEHRCKHTQ